ncbi:uncharacterized protein BP5553_05317 [Venustampulla echinocandica]|uniref:RBR-type E3 ubiquitin transferase n=1 Tax=Venustampulla echinocandica TaxID=2656787 RepID=A0A370TQU4_9HELO|nr:uncharacterized protein BP5553_05317 [Venustampulla echinocandica]RDL37884.1 hypothetical protein BP5553_05317 [Venustampulla echinocandica]
MTVRESLENGDHTLAGLESPTVTRTVPPSTASSGPGTSMLTPDERMVNTCTVCLESVKPDDILYTCTKCTKGEYCATCLKDWFLDACRNEAKMPPKCCKAIPLVSISNLLTIAEIDLYKEKYLEWSTDDRRYCPIRSCSAFIPPSLLLEPSRTPERETQQLESLLPENAQQTTEPPQWVDLQLYIDGWEAPKKPLKPNVACPKCSVMVCTRCRSVSHLGDCPPDDISAHFQEKLRKLNVKRCPKCRAGIRKMVGCSHIECRCGAHFCWECMRPMNVCDGECEDNEDLPYGASDYPTAADDLDGNLTFQEGDGDRFGNEPSGGGIETWLCAHVWFRPIILNPAVSSKQAPLECNRCFRVVTRPEDDKEIQTVLSQGVNATCTVWQCVGGHSACSYCPKASPTRRSVHISRLWTCSCGSETCAICEKEVASTQKALNDEKGWECQCTLVLCGACKNLA